MRVFEYFRDMTALAVRKNWLKFAESNNEPDLFDITMVLLTHNLF